jgi:hypothetical protein
MSIFLHCYLTFVKPHVENFLPVAGGISEFFLNLVTESQQKRQVKTALSILNTGFNVCTRANVVVLAIVIILLPCAGRW